MNTLIGSITDDHQALNGPEINEVNVVFVKYPDDCCPRLCIEKCSVLHIFEHTVFGQTYWKFRCHMFSLVENNYFETFIIIMILASSLALVGIWIWMLVWVCLVCSSTSLTIYIAPWFEGVYSGAEWVSNTIHYNCCRFCHMQEPIHSVYSSLYWLLCRIIWIFLNKCLPLTASINLTLLFSSGPSAPWNTKSISCAEKHPGALGDAYVGVERSSPQMLST